MVDKYLIRLDYFTLGKFCFRATRLTFTCSKSTIKTLEKTEICSKLTIETAEWHQ